MTRFIVAKFLAVMAMFSFMTGSALAALPASITTDVAEAKTDMLAALALVISAMVAVWGLKKLASKLGWL